MKLPIALLLLLLFVQFGHTRELSFPQKISNALSNKVSEFTDYMREKGRSLKRLFTNNEKNKVITYSDEDSEIYREDDDKSGRIKRKFNGYIAEAQRSNNQIFDNIAPIKINYTCTDDDPAVHMNTLQLIALHGYHSESHTVTTDDGYILTIHRIPYSKNSATKSSPRKTALLHHGLLGSSADWIIPGPGKSLGYILSDAGYDVWLANVRGNTYSRAHVSRNIDKFEFWNFTFHDISQNDLPAVIDYIMELKGWDTKINYVGHSMGTTVLFSLLSTKTQYNKILRAGFALAPVAYMSDVKSPISLLAKYANQIEYLMKLLGANEFLPQNSVLRWLSKHACEINHYEEAICENSMFVLCGHDESQFNRTLLPLILAHTPAGASTKTLVHYAQEIRNAGRFQQFDYGPEGNMRQYGSVVAPQYPVQNITLPIALFSSENDWLASDVDVSNLYVNLRNPIEHYIVPYKQFNHLDFIWAIDAPKLLYQKVLTLMEEGAENIIGNDINFK